ncbi:hypothetical protein STVA_14710 [Allostella vacuolata]|nr:hypothetical protein STVA_14710 [Stella vacuolata]
MTSSDAAVLAAQKQLDAYNARDIDAFLEWWADDCRYYAFPDRLLASGKAEVRARHLARFEEPNLFGRLVARTALDDLVVDREVVTRTFAEGPGADGPGEVDVLAIYQVEAGRIARAWFKMGAPRLHPPGTVTLRPAAPRDAATVRALTRGAYARWVPVIGREPLPMRADYDAAVRHHRIDLLCLDGRPVALIEMIPEADHLLIENVAVAPDCQGRGLGRRLLAHAERVAAELGHAEMRLYTNKLFAANVELYRKVGYAIDREEPFMGGFTVYMRKRLK